MKIKYESVTENIEIEVPDEWGTVVIDLDRREYNNDHAETRRHCSLYALNVDDAYLPSDVDVFESVTDAEEKRALYRAIDKLEPQQRELVWRIHFLDERAADIARDEGVSKTAIHNRLKKIYTQLQKNLSQGG